MYAGVMKRFCVSRIMLRVIGAGIAVYGFVDVDRKRKRVKQIRDEDKQERNR